MPLTVYQAAVLEKTAREVIRDLKDRLIERDHKATGELDRSLTYEFTDTGVVVYVNDYIYSLEFGKSPEQARAEGWDSVFNGLMKWVEAKGIQPFGDMSYNTLVYWMARKQMREGTVIYRETQGRGTGLFDGIIDSALAIELADELGNEHIKAIASEIVERFAYNTIL